MVKLLIVLLVLVCSIATAGATTIELTSGRVWMDQNILFDTCVHVDDSATLINACQAATYLFGDLDGTTTVPFYSFRVFLNGIWYDPTDPGPGAPFVRIPNLIMNFVHEPITTGAPGVDPVHVPFTMTGTLDLLHPDTGDPVAFDLAGHGTLSRYWYPEPTIGHPFLHVEFAFAVPEASSLLLLAVGMTALVIRYVA